MTIATLFTWGFVFSFLLQLSLPFPFGRRVHLFMQCPWFALFPPSILSFLFFDASYNTCKDARIILYKLAAHQVCR